MYVLDCSKTKQALLSSANFPGGLLTINDAQSFNDLCRNLVKFSTELNIDSQQTQSALFQELRVKIQQRKKDTIATSWGGVVIHVHQHPLVEKHLVVDAGKYLALEKHELKEETLKVEAGHGILIHRVSSEASELEVSILKPGVEVFIAPQLEHCVIAISNLLIFEKSLDHKGMDKDLIFIYLPE